MTGAPPPVTVPTRGGWYISWHVSGHRVGLRVGRVVHLRFPGAPRTLCARRVGADARGSALSRAATCCRCQAALWIETMLARWESGARAAPMDDPRR